MPQQLKYMGPDVLRMFQVCRRNAARRGIAFELDDEWLTERWQRQRGRCAMTGTAFARAGVRSPWAPSVDRINSRGAYTAANCRLVCLIYNYAKNEFADRDVIKFAQGLLGARSEPAPRAFDLLAGGPNPIPAGHPLIEIAVPAGFPGG
jgi:hypothetical protein